MMRIKTNLILFTIHLCLVIVLLNSCTVDSSQNNTETSKKLTSNTDYMTSAESESTKTVLSDKEVVKKYPFLSDDVESYRQPGAEIFFKKDPYYNYGDAIDNFQFEPGWDDDLYSYYNKNRKEIRLNGDNIVYKDYRNGVEIMQYLSLKKHIIIPEKINGKKVIKLGGFIVGLEPPGYGLSDDDIETSPMAKWPCLFSCTNMENVFIPAGVKEIQYGNFDGWLKKITVSKKNKYYSSKDGILYNKKGTRKLCVPNYHHSGEDWIMGN